MPILNQDDLYVGTYGQNVLQGLSDEEAAYLHVYSLLKLLNSPQGDVEDREGRACLLYQGLLDSQKRELPISHFGQLLLKVSPICEDLKIIAKERLPLLRRMKAMDVQVYSCVDFMCMLCLKVQSHLQSIKS